MLNIKAHSEKSSIDLQKALTDATITLRDAGVDSPRIDAEVLLCKSLGISRSQLYARLKEHVSLGELRRFQKLVKRRARRVPLQYITGHTEFMSLDFLLKRGIFVPRPETELVVEAVLERADTTTALRILDIGTGCGNIAVTIAVGLRRAGAGDIRVYASDVSSRALRLARLNARRHGVESIVSFHRGSLYQAFKRLGLEGKIDFIVSNPPYVPQGEWEGLQPEVRDYEDPVALVAGRDGLDCYRGIVSGAHVWLGPAGWLILEVGEGQAGSIKGLITGNGHFRDTEIIRDLQGIERIVIARAG